MVVALLFKYMAGECLPDEMLHFACHMVSLWVCRISWC
jgi:hypothetical protein